MPLHLDFTRGGKVGVMKPIDLVCWSVLAGTLCGLAHAQVGEEIASAREEPLPQLKEARVTLPYHELKTLWESVVGRKTATPPPAPPPVGFIVSAAVYDLEMRGDGPVILRAGFRGRSLAGGWQEVPLLDGDFRLVKAEPEGADVVWTDSGYALLVEEKGAFDAVLEFSGPPVADLLHGGGLRFAPGAATGKRLTASGLPSGREVAIDGVSAAVSETEGQVFHLTSATAEYVIRVRKTGAEASGPPAPSEWDVHSQVGVCYGDGRLSYACRLYCRAEEGSGQSIDILLPRNASSIEVEGDDVGGSEVVAAGDGRRRLRVLWKSRGILDRKLNLSYQAPQSPLAKSWTVSGPVSGGTGESRILYALVPPDGLELSGQHVLTASASPRLPAWLQEQLGGSDFLTAEAAGPLVLTARWLPRVKTADAIVTRAEFVMRLVDDGSHHTVASYAIAHQAPLNWKVELPVGCEILSCKVNDSPARPVLREDAVEFSLTASGDEAAITFSYTGRSEPLDPVSGSVELELPLTGLFIDRLDWELTLPADFETTAVSGNVKISRDPKCGKGGKSEKDAGSAVDSGRIRLVRRLCRGDRPAVEVHYRKKGVGQ